jgi:PIN domain nuclease of toxin-antitoxin system
MSESYLLDTDAWMAFLSGDDAILSKTAQKKLLAAAAKDQLLVSDVSVWEVASRAANGRIELWPTLDDWLKRAGSAPGITYLPLDRETLILSTRVPGEFGGDSTDRIVLAAAALNGLGVATADPAILDYGKRFGRIPMLDITR